MLFSSVDEMIVPATQSSRFNSDAWPLDPDDPDNVVPTIELRLYKDFPIVILGNLPEGESTLSVRFTRRWWERVSTLEVFLNGTWSKLWLLE